MHGPSLSTLPSQVAPAGLALPLGAVPARNPPSVCVAPGGLEGGGSLSLGLPGDSLSLGLLSRKRKGVPLTPTREEWLRLKKTSRVRGFTASSSSVVSHAGKVISRTSLGENARSSSSSPLPEAGKVIPFCLRTGSDELCLPPVSTHIKPLKKEATNEWEVKPSRVGGPGRKLYLRGSKHNVQVAETSQESVVRAVAAYEDEKLAQGTKVALNSRLKWWLERCRVRRWAPYPLTVAKLQYMGALLKASKYRSATQYLAATKRKHTSLGFAWDDSLNLEFSDACRSCSRGLGPAKQTGYFEVDALSEWSKSTRRHSRWPQVRGGPILPRETTEVACHWVLREIEISSAQVGAISFQRGEGCGSASFNLPVSKCDISALGKVRTHGCACPAACPVGALRKLFSSAIRKAPGGAGFGFGVSGSGSAGRECLDFRTEGDLVKFPMPGTSQEGLPEASSGSFSEQTFVLTPAIKQSPLSPTPEGGFPTKSGMVKVFRLLGKELGVTKHITGHMPRVSGAVRLARAGLDIWKIQIFCRWGSDVVLRYIQEAPLEQSHKWAKEAARGLGLSEASKGLASHYISRNPEVSVPDKDVKLASEQALEVLHKSMRIELEKTDDKWASVLSILEGKLELVASRVGMDIPKFVLNNFGKCKVHLTRNDRFTVCGWEWYGHRHAVSRAALAEGDSVCSKCRAMS